MKDTTAVWKSLFTQHTNKHRFWLVYCAISTFAMVGCENMDTNTNKGANSANLVGQGKPGSGLIGVYFNNKDFTDKAMTRVDPKVDFDWGQGSPDSSIGSNSFSARWTGFVKATHSEKYTFYTVGDDGIRLFIDDKPVVDDWSNHGARERNGTISLEAGELYAVKLEYYEDGGGAVAKLLWSSPSRAKQVVPNEQLFQDRETVKPPDDEPIITASGENSMAGETKEKAFDGKTSTKWLTFSDSAWIQYDFAGDTRKVITQYSITSANDHSERDPRDWRLLGSDDGVHFTTLDERSLQSFSSRFQTKTFAVTSPNPFKMYRLDIASNLNPPRANSTHLAEIELIEGDMPATGNCVEVAERQEASLACPAGGVITDIDFASYGLPTGSCDEGFKTGMCHALTSQVKVEQACLQRSSCTVEASNPVFGDPCIGNPKRLAVVYTCGSDGGGSGDDKDTEDLCPEDPNKIDPGECGCGVPEGSCGQEQEDAYYEAEDRTQDSGCQNATSHDGYSGSGFMDFGGKGTWIEWNNIVVSRTDTFTLTFRYANGGSSSRPATVKVNGQNVGDVSFAPTGNWNTWGTNSIEASLRSGNNTIRVTASSGTGGPNLDQLLVSSTDGNPNITCDYCGTCDADPTNDCMQGIEYYGTNVPKHLTPVSDDYALFNTNISFKGGLDGLNHGSTDHQGAGKFVFNRIYRASKYGQNLGEQFGIFHWWLSSYGNNSIEGGIWVNAKPAGPHYYPTLHLAGVGDCYHICTDVGFGSGLYDVYIGDRWRTMVQISNRVLFIPGVNIAFDKDQPPYEEDNGMWIGWGWSYFNLDHPRNYKFWTSFIESYDYQGPINGYIPEHFNFIDPEKIESGDYAHRQEMNDPFGTFATLGAKGDSGIANEQYSFGLRVNDDVYYVPVPRMPAHKDREYLVANVQKISQDVMEDYSDALKANAAFDSLISTDFVPFNGIYSTTHSQLKIHEKIDGEEHLTVVRPPYTIGYDTYNGYVEWDTATPAARRARAEENGFLYYRKLSERWEATGSWAEHPHLYKSELILPPDDVERVPRVNPEYNSYKERNANHPDFSTWDTGGRTRYRALLQNGSTVTYVWYRFIEQPAFQTAKRNWPDVYTDEYLELLQTYVENLHRKVAQESRVNPSDPVVINYRNADNADHFEPHLARLDPAQLVEPPPGFNIGYVPVIISVYHPEGHSRNGTGIVDRPNSSCSNSDWTNTYFPDIP